MARRSRAREAVLQVLFQSDFNTASKEDDVRSFLKQRLQDKDLEEFATQLYRGTLEHRTEIDSALAQLSENWSVERMTGVDRNVLRLGAYELLHHRELPFQAVIDEAVELARRYGTAESSAFVNAILDRLANKRGEATVGSLRQPRINLPESSRDPASGH
jgi:N utilization substance protein B